MEEDKVYNLDMSKLPKPKGAWAFYIIFALYLLNIASMIYTGDYRAFWPKLLVAGFFAIIFVWGIAPFIRKKPLPWIIISSDNMTLNKSLRRFSARTYKKSDIRKVTDLRFDKCIELEMKDKKTVKIVYAVLNEDDQEDVKLQFSRFNEEPPH